MEKIRKKVLNKEKRKTTVKGKEQEYKGKKEKEEDRREKERRWKKRQWYYRNKNEKCDM